ncbi:hypothetical protein V7157_03855 [Neobacillus drentensis]|uniref:hypothetical protein n=1 Tax=Neobacillus drentensis TaxID=220684 RepID=UPI002FFD78A6
MSEFEQGAYQSADYVEPSEPSIQQEPSETQKPATTQESNYFEIKYNKEPVKVSYDEAPDYIQKGMNYDKVQQRATEYEQHLNRVAQLSGYETHEDFIEALEQAEIQQKQAQELQRFEEAGIDPDKFNQLLENHPDMQYAREMRAQEQEQYQIRTEIEQLREQFPDLTPDDLTDELFSVKEQRGVPLLHAYLELNYSKLAQQKEQEAIQKLQTNALSTPGSLGAGADHKVGYSNLSLADKKALREKVLRGEITEL